MDINTIKPNLTILRAISGAGKSRLAQAVTPLAVVCSADDHFMVDGEYRFDPSQLSEAHGACFRKAVEALQAGVDVVIDNTNTSTAEVAPYVVMGQAYADRVRIIRIDCDPEVAHARNGHGVPLWVVLAMADRLKSEPLPPFFPAEEVVKAWMPEE